MMGEMVDGVWRSGWHAPDDEGQFKRPQSVFRGRILNDPKTSFPSSRAVIYLYASYACPWATRALIMRKVKHLEKVVGVSIVDPHMGDDGWVFGGKFPRSTVDEANHTKRLQDIYKMARMDYTGRVTVPVLWDTKKKTIVSNESREVMRMFDHELGQLGDRGIDLCPPALAARVDSTLDAIYEPINNGVYRAGFATTQEAYSEACRQLLGARPLRRSAGPSEVPVWRDSDGSRHRALCDFSSVRPGLLFALQMQFKTH